MSEPHEEHHSYRAQGPQPPEQGRAEQVIYELSVEHARKLDRLCVERYGIPSIVLMENAAIGLAAHARAMLGDSIGSPVVIFAGPGNNGGDGFALARHLHNANIPVRVVLTQARDTYSGDAAINLNIVERMGIQLIGARAFLDTEIEVSASLLVDALFGTGLSRAIEGDSGELIRFMNRARHQRGVPVLAVDCPSGLDAQSGEPIGERVVRADRTVTFAGFKPGMARVEALEYLGEVHVAPIGAPIELLAELGQPLQPRHRE